MSINTSLNLYDRMSMDFEDLTNTSPDLSAPFLHGWTWACDTKARYTACSPEVVEILGVDAQAFEGQALANFALSKESAELLQAALDKGAFPVEVRLNFQRSNGTLMPAAVHILPTFSLTGEESGWHGFTIALSTQDESLPQEDFPVHPEEVPVKAVQTQSPIHNLASVMILETLDAIQASSPIISEYPKSSVTVNELSESAQYGFTSGNGTNVAEHDQVIEIEHKLKWGKKFDFDYEEDLFVRRSMFAKRGLRGHMERLSAPQKILKCDLRWIAVILRIDDGSSQVWVDYPEAGKKPHKINLSDFLENPDLLKPEIENALNSPWESIITYQRGVDYMMTPDKETAVEPF